ncbi:hypothetical protein [Nocardia sp. NPDC058705]|uniref:hypothetical protein n=1 Tax=Nocardia sp. NPDC058705 TaxID=3346609 RepID=UPI00369ECE16
MASGASSDDNAARSWRSRRTIYLNFPGGKAELVAEATRVAGRAVGSLLSAIPATASATEAVSVLVEIWKHTLRTSDFTAGCPVVAATLGRDESPDAADSSASS